ncbi:uncharacterized protein LOC103482096 [Poecilia reticulata]|uniref:uncharacterized protein LOC103482096 n=1 Tax=Poecilia reticulata TaxID=8081 RepID=UPI0007EBC117|nr:PREDICTED: uncharacterized protein LOC103482096 [Poecilia reticulata]
MRKFYALLSLYISCVYGHRTGVLQNMTVQEVAEARSARDEELDEGFLINKVKDHKTNRAFGSAQVFLTPEEFGWVERWIAVRAGLQPITDLLMFSEGNRRVKNLLLPMQKTWAHLGLPGTPTVTDIRTSIATYARDHLPTEQRMVVSSVMCHDVSTAEKYYAVDRSCSQLAAIRKVFDGLTDPRKSWAGKSSQKGAVVVVVAAAAAASVESDDQERQGGRRRRKRTPSAGPEN